MSQTSGERLPAPPIPQLLAGHAPQGLWDALAAQCTAAGFTVTRAPIAGDAGPNGYTAYATHQVVIRSDVDEAQAVKTLAHELGHVLMHDPAGFERGQTGSCRGNREVEAESLAYLVAADHGLDTAEYTFAYVAGWAAQTGDVDAALRASGARVLATAHQVLDRTHDHLTTEPGAVVASDADKLATRTAAGAERTGALRARAENRAQDPEHDFLHRDRLVAANAAAAAYYASQYPASWARAYLDTRLGSAMLDDPAGHVGYAPAGWTHLTEHLRSQGFADAEILGAGLGTRASTDRVVDRFRDRLMFPIEARTEGGGREVVGFVGRRNPSLDVSTDTRNPKYLNTGQTPLYTKGQHLYGLAENTAVLDRGGLGVLVEGPIDALAVDLASGGMMAGLAPLGTALTDHQAGQLADALGAARDRIVVATDADPAGVQAAARAYELLTAHGLDPRGAPLPAGMDPAQLAELHGPAVLVDRLATAESIGRQLVDQALTGRELTWPEDRVAAARVAAGIIAKAPLDTWQRELTAVSKRTGLQESTLQTVLAERIGAPDTDDDALGRLTGRDRRDDLDRGQHVTATAAQLAAMSTPRSADIRPATARPADDARPSHRLTATQARSRH
ncbi:toprim domain-containing protein [Jatrophihabitans lederbergiae]|uniref:Toprim domain-containing protein n=1 Tax=Jatrophihabitans lederbergiae TaxID=3075547 RepID=A0ABU2JDA7_9ACTN|nr:toprim domain-containing protein [Jatrophihabitans sp. DSM 44399]MDT0262459.1 toprim domain-containing protein [Jatrophihabitans sp. DSM 44399]